MTRIAFIGEAMIELSIDREAAQVGVAGDTLNAAIYMRRVAPDLQIDYVTCLGDDPFSDRIRNFIEAQDIGVEAIRHIPGALPGLYAITTSPEGERDFTYWRSTSAARQLFGDRAFERLGDYDGVCLSGISLAILPQEVRLGLLQWLQKSSVKVIYDSNYRPRLWENQKVAREITAAYWNRADIALPSIDDEMALFEETEKLVMARFADHRGTGALKRGDKGPISLGEAVDQSYLPAPKVIDTTAAGDSFNGAYLGSIFSGASQAEALLQGHKMASVVVQHRGAIIPR